MSGRIPQSLTLSIIAVMAVAAAGCGDYARPSGPADDEAMRRLRWENEIPGATKRTPQEAARQWFLPYYYFDPARATDNCQAPNQPGGIRDYFPGMDQIVVSPEWMPNKGPTLDTPVFQLSDKEMPDFHFENPLETYNEVLGRNTWMLWCGGNEGFWDWIASDSLGFIDLLKLVDSRKRLTRFKDAGLINEPEMVQGGGKDQFGLWLDMPADGETRRWRDDYLRQTFEAIRYGIHESQRGLKRYENNSKYAPRREHANTYSGMDGYSSNAYPSWYGDADDAPPPPEIYGLSSGIVGLRLFPNPNFDDEARKKWDPERYYDEADENYWNDPELIRPYRVGLACAFCHASFHPLRPPRDITNPGWENISGNIGAQYLRIRAAFGNLLKPKDFVYHILDSQPPGTIDTSLIASDNINNPNTMNSVFNLPQRALISLRNPKEAITAASATQPSLWRHPESDPPAGADDVVPDSVHTIVAGQSLTAELENSNSHPPRHVPRILLDGSDSIGAWGALARVYLNIGTYYEQWNRLHRVVIGFDAQQPFRISDCEQHSVYWQATQLRVPGMRDYFLKATPPMPLLALDGVAERTMPIDVQALREKAEREKSAFAQLLGAEKARRVDVTKLDLGRKVFARNCIVCHSSIQPSIWHDHMQRGAESGEFWIRDPVQLLSDPEYVKWAEAEVDKADFWRLNFLSSDYRVPITLVNTNAGRALATNAIDRNMWDDFASEDYQGMRSVGAIQYFNPYRKDADGADQFVPRHRVRNNAPAGGGGPGFYRVPTLVSIWATAPLLHNNSLGRFTNDPSVDGRLVAFDDAIRKLLWPDRRLESSDYNEATPERLKQDHGLIWRTTEDSYLTISGRRVPGLLAASVPPIMTLVERYEWLKNVRPLWLPSALLLFASFIYLMAEPRRARLVAATGADCAPKPRLGGPVAVLLAIVVTLLLYYLRGTQWASTYVELIHPLWLPGAMLLLTGVVLLSLGDARRTRWLAWTSLLAAVGLTVVYLRHAYPRWFSWLEIPNPLVLLSATLLLVGTALVWPEGRRRNPLLWYARVAFALEIGLGVVYLWYWLGWMRAVHWLALIIGLLAAFGVAVIWLGDPRRTRPFFFGLGSLGLAALLYLLFALDRFSWAMPGHRIALLVLALALASVVFLWLGDTRRKRLLGGALLGFALVLCLLHAGRWSLGYLSHPLGIAGVILLLVAVILIAFIEAPFIRIIAYAILFLALTALVFSIVLAFPEAVPGYVQSAGPLWPLGVILLLIALLFFWIPDPHTLARRLAYLALLLAILSGSLTYFLNGKLGDFSLGPIPKGTPVNLLANINPDADPRDVRRAIKATIGALTEIESQQLNDEETLRRIRDKIAPELMRVSKCPDFVMDKGHYFEWFRAMTDEEKDALIELLKTF